MNNQGLGHEGCQHLTEALSKGRRNDKANALLLKVFGGGRNRLENFGVNLLSKVFCDMGSLEDVSAFICIYFKFCFSCLCIKMELGYMELMVFYLWSKLLIAIRI